MGFQIANNVGVFLQVSEVDGLLTLVVDEGETSTVGQAEGE